VKSFDHAAHELATLARPLALAFAAEGFSLYAVGGSVRDALLGLPRDPEDFEIDFTTNARPDDIARLMKPVCGGLWEQGRAFGTIGGVVKATGIKAEITTFRSEEYVDHSRKPAVTWGDSLEADLSRRDFTINAIALDVIALAEESVDLSQLFDPSAHILIDPFGGIADLKRQVLRAPIDPVVLFTDDPLRTLRAARFAARFELTIDPELEAAAVATAEQLTKVSAERIHGELDLLLLTKRPSIGLDFIVRTGLADHFFPELPKLQLEQDPIHHHKDVLKHTWAVVDNTQPRLRLRLAALFHDIGKPPTRAITEEGVTFRFHEVVGARMTRTRMTALKYSKQMIDEVSALVEMHLRFHTYKMGWSESAVRRYVNDAGDLLEDLNELTRCDCTTRNRRKAAYLAGLMDELEEKIVALREKEGRDAVRPALDGEAIMRVLGIAAGPDVGRAWKYLKEVALDEGQLDEGEAEARLKSWWAENHQD